MYTRRAIDERRQLGALISDAGKLARSIEDGGWFSSGLPGPGQRLSIYGQSTSRREVASFRNPLHPATRLEFVW
jgi:hypothetical protein